MSNLSSRPADRSNRPLHKEIKDLLPAYIAGELDDEMEQVFVELHISGCITCQQAIVEIFRTLQAKRAVPPMRDPLPPKEANPHCSTLSKLMTRKKGPILHVGRSPCDRPCQGSRLPMV